MHELHTVADAPRRDAMTIEHIASVDVMFLICECRRPRRQASVLEMTQTLSL
jgi:hypothetical protein